MSATGSHREAGMTLLEVLVAVAILSLITALAFPALEQQRRSLQSRYGAQMVMADIARIRAAAIASALPTRFAVLSRGTYAAGGGIFQTPQGVTLAGGELLFFPDGTEEGDGIVIATDKKRFVMRVDPVLGSMATDGTR